MRDFARILTALVGGALAALGIALGAMWLIWPFLNRDNLLGGATLLAGAATLAVLYGGILIVRALHRGDGAGWWPPAWVAFVGWGIVLALGAVALGRAESSAFVPWVLSSLAVLGIGLPSLGILAFAMRRSWPPAGPVMSQLVFGGTIAVLVSLLMQLGLLLTLGALTLAVSGQGAGLSEWVTALLRGDLGALGGLRATPLLLATTFLARVILAPLIEEAAKAMSLPLWSGWQPSRERAIVWGLAAGLGFALTEGLLLGAPQAVTGGWWPTMIDAAGTAVVQGVATAMVGLGWWRARERGNLWPLAGAYLAAVFAHGFWNLTGLARTLVADVPMGTVTTTEPALDVLFGDMVGTLGAIALLALLAGVLIRITGRKRWAEIG